MWARRCGAPKHWPSRIRVTIHSFINAGVGFAIFKYLTAADVGYLDLSGAVKNDVLCLDQWPLYTDTDTWLSDDSYQHWANAIMNSDGFVEAHQCPIAVTSEAMVTCNDARIPVKGLQRKLGRPLGADRNINSDVVSVYSGIFLYLGLCLFVCTTVHDLALVSLQNKNQILDMRGVRKYFPRLLDIGYFLAGSPCIRRLRTSGKVGRIVFIILIPLISLWGLAASAVLWWPIAVLYWLRHPIKLSRLAVFANALLFSLFGLGLTLHALVFLCDRELRPVYAITWVPQEGVCFCGCTFHIAKGSIMQILLIGITVVFKGSFFAFRCLKGLRRANWASLLTVMFPVPLSVYPVRWTTPAGLPIQHRKEGEPVQGELGFDPFALMDEQPESARMTLRLEPSLVEDFKLEDDDCEENQEISGPTYRTQASVAAGRAEDSIGCCGFPYQGKGSDSTCSKASVNRLPSNASNATNTSLSEPVKPS